MCLPSLCRFNAYKNVKVINHLQYEVMDYLLHELESVKCHFTEVRQVVDC